MNIHTPVGDVVVNRDKGFESFRIEIQFNDGEDWYKVDPMINPLVDDHISARSDITQSVIQEAVDEWFEQTDNDVTAVRAINVKSIQEIRKTPHELRQSIGD